MIGFKKLDISKFKSDGYQIFEEIIPQEIILDVRDFLTRSISETLGPAKLEIGCSSDSDLLRIINNIAAGHQGGVGGLSKSTRDALSGHLSLETRLSKTLWKIPYAAKLQEILIALLGDELHLHMPPTARYVLPGNVHAGVPPHQDISYNKHMTDFITVWVPLVDIDDACGGVTVYEGSGNAPEYETGKTDSEFWQQGVPTAGYQPVHCAMKAGGVLVLNKWIIHGSTANRSANIRISVDYRFFGGADRSTKHFLDMKRQHVIQPAQENA
jgi:hypothetical protein